jgi:hypothetical protein
VRPRVLRALAFELEAHSERLDAIDRASRGLCLWKTLLPVEGIASIEALG